MISAKKQQLTISLSLIMIALILGSIFASESLVLIIASIVFVLIIVYSLYSFEKNAFLFCFLICFFTYLLSGQLADRALGVYNYNFSQEIETHTDICLLISLVGLFIGYYLVNKITITINGRKPKAEIDYEGYYCRSARKLSRYVFFFTYAFFILTVIDKILFVFRYGYVSYYINYTPSINALFRILGAMAPSAFCMFLATMPTKEEAKVPLIMYVMYLLLTLGTGRRINMMTGFVFLFAYFLCRNSVNPDKEKPWLTRTAFIRIMVAVPVLIMLMYLFEYIRSDFYVGSSADYAPILGFFVRQGTSINVIKFTEKFSSGLDPEAKYSFYNTIRWLQGSFLNNLLGLNYDFYFGSQSELTALHGTNLADYVSYNAMRNTYLRGGGWGSCYIAELYVDFGYMGVFLGNVLYGMLLGGVLKSIRSRNNIWLTACGFLIVDALFKAPRAVFDGFIWNFLYFYNWGVILIVFIITQYSYQQKLKMEENLKQISR